MDWFATRAEFGPYVREGMADVGGWRGAQQGSIQTVTVAGRISKRAVAKIVQSVGGDIPGRDVNRYIEKVGATTSVSFSGSLENAKAVAEQMAEQTGQTAYHLHPALTGTATKRTPILTVTGSRRGAEGGAASSEGCRRRGRDADDPAPRGRPRRGLRRAGTGAGSGRRSRWRRWSSGRTRPSRGMVQLFETIGSWRHTVEKRQEQRVVVGALSVDEALEYLEGLSPSEPGPAAPGRVRAELDELYRQRDELALDEPDEAPPGPSRQEIEQRIGELEEQARTDYGTLFEEQTELEKFLEPHIDWVYRYLRQSDPTPTVSKDRRPRRVQTDADKFKTHAIGTGDPVEHDKLIRLGRGTEIDRDRAEKMLYDSVQKCDRPAGAADQAGLRPDRRDQRRARAASRPCLHPARARRDDRRGAGRARRAPQAAQAAGARPSGGRPEGDARELDSRSAAATSRSRSPTCRLRRAAEGGGSRRTNWILDQPEPGLSVYGVWKDPKTGKYVVPSGSEQYLATFDEFSGRPIYQVTGEAIRRRRRRRRALARPGEGEDPEADQPRRHRLRVRPEQSP